MAWWPRRTTTRGRCGDGGRLGTEATLERPPGTIRPVRIAIDARAAAEVPAGRGRYVRELLRALADLDADHAYDL